MHTVIYHRYTSYEDLTLSNLEIGLKTLASLTIGKLSFQSSTLSPFQLYIWSYQAAIKYYSEFYRLSYHVSYQLPY